MRRNLLHFFPLDALRGFVNAAHRLNISLAAQDLQLTQSAVSRQIQTIEQYLRTPLFIRKHRALVLTRTGEQLFALASPWMHQLIQLTDSVRYGDQTRPVTITASLGVASLWIVPRLGAISSSSGVRPTHH